MVIEDYNAWFKEHYNFLLNYTINVANSINNKEVNERWAKDMLHDSYIQTCGVINQREELNYRVAELSTAVHFQSYTFIVIRSFVLMKERERSKRNNEQPFEQLSILAERKLRAEQVDADDRVDYLNDLEFLSRCSVEYIRKKYSPTKQYLFKTYFFNEGMTYRKVGVITGYSISYISDTVCKIKKDLRINLIPYIMKNYE